MVAISYRPVCYRALLLCLVLAAPSVAVFDFPSTNKTYTYPSESPNATTPLYFGLMQSFSGGFISSGVIPGIEVALDQINQDESILPGYSLHYMLVDSECERMPALESFFKLTLNYQTLVAWIGSGCSTATVSTAQISHYYNVTQISCVSSSSELRDRSRFRYYHQLLLTDDNLASGFFSIITGYNWRRVAIIEQDETLFTATMEALVMNLNESGIDFSVKSFPTDRGIAALGSQIFEEEVRVFVLAMYAPFARDILCEAYRRGLMYPTHVFLTLGWFPDGWWREGDHSCTPDQRERVAQYSLGPLQFEFISDTGAVSDTGINGSEFNTTYFNRIQESPLNLTEEFQPYSAGCYDATWMLAYALNKTIQDLESKEDLRVFARTEAEFDNSTTDFGLEDFTYRNNIIAETMFGHLSRTNFNGLSGPVIFDDQGIRTGGFQKIRQVRSDSSERWMLADIGELRDTEDFPPFTYTGGFTDDTLWPGGLVPYDGVPIEEIVTVDVSLTVIYTLMATAGIVFTVICLGFNFVFRDRKLIRLTSPNLNYAIGVGALMLYIDVIFLVIPTTDKDAVSALCNITPWLTSLGYSLCFGTMLAKMIRVYYIFNNPSPSKAKVPDWKLALVILLLVVVDLVILTVYVMVEGARGRLEASRIRNKENEEDVEGEREIIYHNYFYTCKSTARDITLGILYGYKGLLQIVSLLFAFQIRKVKVKGLNDAKYITAAVYETSVVLAVIVVSTYTLVEYVNIYPLVIGLGLLVGATGILIIAFVPIMVRLYRDPHGEHVFSSSTQMPSQHSYPPTSERLDGSHEHRLGSSVEVSMDAFDSLRRRVRDLEGRLSKYEPTHEHAMEEANGTTEVHGTREVKVSFVEEDNKETSDYSSSNSTQPRSSQET